MNLPTDILQIIFDLLLGTIENKPCSKIHNPLYQKLFLVNKEFNKLTHKYYPDCRSKILKFGNNRWCKIHEENEWSLANFINTNKKNFKQKNADNNLSDKVSFHFENYHSDNYLKQIFYKITKGMPYRFSHSCCSGKGFMFYT